MCICICICICTCICILMMSSPSWLMVDVDTSPVQGQHALRPHPTLKMTQAARTRMSSRPHRTQCTAQQSLHSSGGQGTARTGVPSLVTCAQQQRLHPLGVQRAANLGAREQAGATTQGIWTGRAEADAETGGDVGQEHPQEHPCVSSPRINSDDTRRSSAILVEKKLPHGSLYIYTYITASHITAKMAS